MPAMMRVDSPLGRITVSFEGEVVTRVRVDRGAMPAPATGPTSERPAAGGALPDESAAAAAVRTQLAEYFAGGRQVFSVPMRPAGSADPFTAAVWAATAAIPYGETRSYGEIAAAVGEPRLAREVGGALARNPLLILVPCHRVIGKNGALTGFAAGVERKRWLLARENPARWADAPAAISQLTMPGTGAVHAAW